MSSFDLEAEVCVIGGGPAGSALARKLALLGHDVCVVEREAFPRPHIGESLPPSVLPLLGLLAVRERIEGAGFLRPARARIDWAEAPSQRPLPRSAPGFQVDRGRFDHLLLAAAQEAGARLLAPALARCPERRGDGDEWTVPLDVRGRRRTLRAGFLVDASGRRSALLRRHRRTSPPTLALFAYWCDLDLEGTETRVEAGTERWYWGAPLPDGTWNIAVFLDPTVQIRGGCRGLEQTYLRCLGESRLLRAGTKGRRVTPVQACDATCYADEAPIFRGGLKVGEASHAIDPLSSQGVQVAIRSGIQGAAVVHTLLSGYGDREAACEFHRQRQREDVESDRAVSTKLYAAQARVHSNPFWLRRAAAAGGPRGSELPDPLRLPGLDLQARLELSPAARLETTPVLEGDCIRTRPALSHPSLERPVAYLAEVPIVQLLQLVETGKSGEEIATRWARFANVESGRKLLHWMWSHRILVAAQEDADSAP